MSRLHERLASLGVDVSSLSPAVSLPEGMLFRLVVPGEEALARWRTLRELVPLTGHWPVVLGGGASLRRLREGLTGRAPTAAALMAAGEALEVAGWLAARCEELALDLEVEPWEAGMGTGQGPAPGVPSLPTDVLTGRPPAQVSVALLPTARPWQVPALLRLGGWSDCPPPEAHVALLRHWHERHGAEVVAVGPDTLELAVPRPASTRAQTERLACEHYVYCPDAVESGAGSLGALAAALHQARRWWFRWD